MKVVDARATLRDIRRQALAMETAFTGVLASTEACTGNPNREILVDATREGIAMMADVRQSMDDALQRLKTWDDDRKAGMEDAPIRSAWSQSCAGAMRHLDLICGSEHS